jgi:hypothetical protein
MLLKKTSILILITGIICISKANAQYYLNPFTQFGLGEFNPLAQVNQLGMGGTTYTQTDENRFNFANPASYSSINYFSFEMGVNGTFYEHKSEDLTFKNIDAKVPYLAFAFPIDWKKRWGFSMGLMPYSSVGYQLQTQTVDTGINKTLYQTGSGGLTKFYMGSSIQVLPGFFAGVNLGYLFGNIQTTQTQVFPSDSGTLYSVHQSTNNVIGGFVCDAGLLYNINFNVPTHTDKQLLDSLQNLKIQELNQEALIKKPESPYERLQKDYLKLDLKLEQSKDSVKSIGLPKLEELQKIANLKTVYKQRKRVIKNSVTQDSINNFSIRIKDYHSKISDIKASYKQKEEALKARRKNVYGSELQNCQAQTIKYRDSIKVFNDPAIIKSANDKIKKYNTEIRILERKKTAVKNRLKKAHESKFNNEISNYQKIIDKYTDSIAMARQPIDKYNYLKNNAKSICSNYIQDHKYTLQLGGTVNLPTYVPFSKSIDAYTFSNRFPLSDSIVHFSTPNQSLYMPLGFGGSLELRNENNLKVVLTAEYRQYSKLKGIGLLDYSSDYYSYGLGVQWTPPKRQFGNNALTTGNYRIGFRYSQLPFLVNNAGVNDMRLTLGIGLPRPTILKFT